MKKTLICTLTCAFISALSPLTTSQSVSFDAELETIQSALSAVVFVAKESNYFIQAYGTDPGILYDYFIRPVYDAIWPPEVAHGSGFIISPDGFVVTNAHVVDGATSLFVVTRDADLRVRKATLIGQDDRSDVALLKIEDAEGIKFPYLEFADSRQIKAGMPVFAIGTPLDFILESTVTRGIISATERNNVGESIEGYLQTDVSINPGNSGGPLMQVDGKVVGINTWGIRRAQGLGFAVPSYTIQNVVKQLKEHGEISQGFLGVELDDSTYTIFDHFQIDYLSGAHVLDVVSGSPADKAGLQEGDTIIEMDGWSVKTAHTLRNYVCVLPPDTIVKLKVVREDEILEIEIKLADEEWTERYADLLFRLVI